MYSLHVYIHYSMLISNEHTQGQFFWMSRSTNLSGNGTTTSVIWIFLLVFSIMISQEETDRPSPLMVFLLLSLFKCDVVKQRHILTPFFTSGHFLRNLIFDFCLGMIYFPLYLISLGRITWIQSLWWLQLHMRRFLGRCFVLSSEFQNIG